MTEIQHAEDGTDFLILDGTVSPTVQAWLGSSFDSWGEWDGLIVLAFWSGETYTTARGNGVRIDRDADGVFSVHS